MEGDHTNALYRECLRNHAASLGSYATDGCGEFTLDDTSPGGLQCAACGCHRNFHRKLTYAGPRGVTCSSGGGRDHHHRHEVQDPAETGGEMMMMMDYGGGRQQAVEEFPEESERSGGKKRFRTKFTVDQKEKMLAFAEKLGWKLLRKDQEEEIERFCRGVGISRQVFKVWMHNHKNAASSSTASTGNASSLTQ